MFTKRFQKNVRENMRISLGKEQMFIFGNNTVTLAKYVKNLVFRQSNQKESLDNLEGIKFTRKHMKVIRKKTDVYIWQLNC